MEIINTTNNSDSGRIVNHASDINISYRYRGRVVRVQTQKKTIKTEINSPRNDVIGKGENMIDAIDDMKKILAYSAIKISANPTDPYSMLNPETSSDSPSAKSKGVRFVSAKQISNQIPIIGANIINI